MQLCNPSLAEDSDLLLLQTKLHSSLCNCLSDKFTSTLLKVDGMKADFFFLVIQSTLSKVNSFSLNVVSSYVFHSSQVKAVSSSNLHFSILH